MKHIVITISRQFGSGGREIGKRVADQLGIPFYDRELITAAAEKTGLDEKLFEKVDQRGTSNLSYSLSEYGIAVRNLDRMWNVEDLYLTQSEVIRELAGKGSCVIVGRCADHVLADNPNHFSVFVNAPMEARIHRVSEQPDQPLKNAQHPRNVLERMDKQRATYYNYYTGKVWGKAENYDLCVNSHSIGIDASVSLILSAVSGLTE